MRRMTIAALAVLLLAPTALVAQTGRDLFQQALVKERADGDLRGAIAIYEQIVREFAQDHQLAANALMQMGRCHEKLGSQDAQRAYRRILEDYADQTDLVQEARARLAVLRTGPDARTPAAEGAITLREIRFDGETTPLIMLSPDETRVVYVYYQRTSPHYSLRVRTLASNKEVVLVDSVGGPSVFCQWSPDGQRVAYVSPARELRTIGATGGSPEVVWSSPPGTSVIPLDWAPDGDEVLVAVRDIAKWSHELVIVPLHGAAPRSLRSGSMYELLDYGQFSPDGAYIAGIQRGDVYVWSVDGTVENRVTTGAAEEEWPFWSPDGRFIVFSSDRSGDKDVWVVPVERGTPTGPPIRVKAGLGRRAMTTGMTAAGGLTVFTYPDGSPDDLFVLDVGRSADSVTGGFRPIARYAAQSFQPRWSPDGTRVVYTSRKGHIGWPRIFVGGGVGQQDLELPTADHYPATVEWGRDGKSVIFPGWRREDGRVGIFRLSLEDEAVEPLHLGGTPGPGSRGVFVNLIWLPAAKRYFVQQLADSSRMDFYVMEADGSGLRRTASAVPTNYWAWPSPDGRRVAYQDDSSLYVFSLDDQTSRALSDVEGRIWYDVTPGWSPDGRQLAWADPDAIRILDTGTGATRLLVTAPPGSRMLGPPLWAPDAQHVVYVVRDTTKAVASRRDIVWVVPATGGSPRKVASAPDTHPELHLEAWLANGTLAAAGGQVSGVRRGSQFWLLEGFLPQTAGARRR